MKLTDEQLAELERFQAQYGRNWKSTLRFCWETGMYPTSASGVPLQQLRNELGPSWLNAYRIGDNQVGYLSWCFSKYWVCDAEGQQICLPSKTKPGARGFAKAHHITLIEDI